MHKEHNTEIIEEILELSRLNQKLLRSPDNRSSMKEIEQMNITLAELKDRLFNHDERLSHSRRRRKNHPMFVEELMHMSSRFEKGYTGLQITLSLFRDTYPWLYDAGIDLVRILRKNSNKNEKNESIEMFIELTEFTFEHPVMREMYGMDKDMHIMGRELRHILIRTMKNIR